MWATRHSPGDSAQQTTAQQTHTFTQAVAMLDQRRRRWADIATALGKCIVFDGVTDFYTSIEKAIEK